MTRATFMAWSSATLLALFSCRAYAQAEGAIAAGVAAGTAAAVVPEPTVTWGQGFEGDVLQDWSDVRSGGTTRMITGCEDIVVEGTLSGSHSHNFLTVTVLNKSSTPMTFLPERVSARFGNGMRRRLAGVAGDTKIDPAWQVTRVFVFPDKRDFQDQHWLEIDLGIQHASACTLTLRFERNDEIEAFESTHTVYTVIEAEVGLGAHFFETGGQRALDKGAGAAVHLDFAFFPSIHHGLSLNVFGDLHDNSRAQDIAPKLVFEGKPTVESTGFMLGYMGRIYVAPWLNVVYNASTGPYVFQLADDSKKSGILLTRAVFPLRHRVRLGATLVSFEDGGQLGLAASLIQTLVPYGRFGTVHLAGSSLSATLDLFIGG